MHCEDHTKPYEGILSLLDDLANHGIKIAVVSNKTDSAVKSLCKKYFGDRIPVALGDKEGISKKPSPDLILSVLNEWNITSDEAIYVGDSEVDIFTGKNAEMDVVCVTWGFRDRDFLMKNGACMFADSAEDLKNRIFDK